MILHLDMDAFFASVEQLDNPGLRDRPVIVGGASKRAVVAAASYEARRFGVHSAMPMFQALKLCPSVAVVPPRRERYAEISGRIMRVIERYSPLVEPVSIDEAFVDISGCERLWGGIRELAVDLKKSIHQTVRLKCSVGVAPLKFLAKIASDMNKPDGLKIITPDQVEGILRDLPVGKVPGVGEVTAKQLKRMNIETLGDVRRWQVGALERRLGKFGIRLMELAGGRDRSAVVPFSESKSVSSETTLEINTRDKDILTRFLLKQSEAVGRDLRQMGVRAKTVQIKIKYADFSQMTRSKTLDQPFRSSEIIYKTACRLLEAHALVQPVRLIGVGVSGLLPEQAPRQMELFQTPNDSNAAWEKVDQALDAIHHKFGREAVTRAAFDKGREDG